MALKISGTTVVNDSRELQNIASLDATTIATIAAAVSPSTSFNGVGSYAIAFGAEGIGYSAGDTTAGSNLGGVKQSFSDAIGGGLSAYLFTSNGSSASFSSLIDRVGTVSMGMSGTWRVMSEGGSGFNITGTTRSQCHLWVRIS